MIDEGWTGLSDDELTHGIRSDPVQTIDTQGKVPVQSRSPGRIEKSPEAADDHNLSRRDQAPPTHGEDAAGRKEANAKGDEPFLHRCRAVLSRVGVLLPGAEACDAAAPGGESISGPLIRSLSKGLDAERTTVARSSRIER